METITLGCFYRSLPMVAASEHGFFEEHGVTVEYDQVTSSIQQFQDLANGRYDVVQTSPDNTANYRFNRDNPVGQRIAGRGFLALDYGMYLVVTSRPEHPTLEDLRGTVLSVDAPDSGFAYVAYKVLASAGLRRGEDYDIVMTGGVYDRYQAMLAGEPFASTLLCGGFETRAQRAGYHLLGDVLSIADPYLGVWATARDDWLEEHRDAATGFVRGYLQGTDWVFDPANREVCLELLQRQPHTDRDLAEELYAIQTRPGVGNVPDGEVEPAAVRNVLDLRQEFGGFEDDLDLAALAQPGGGLYDDELLRAVRAPS